MYLKKKFPVMLYHRIGAAAPGIMFAFEEGRMENKSTVLIVYAFCIKQYVLGQNYVI